MRFTVDSNLLVYALDRSDPPRHEIAADIMVRAMLLDCVLTAQAIAEFLNVVRRKRREYFDAARAQAERWTTTFSVLGTESGHVLKAAEFAARHKLQLWDCIIWQVARSAHAGLFLSEDMQDGLSIDGMTVLNPFDSGNRNALRALLEAGADR